MRARSVILTVLGLAGIVTGLVLAGAARAAEEPPAVAEHVDLQRYLGTWYEIASIPNFFQRNCTGTTATYSLHDDGAIEVLNRCHKHTLDGSLSEARGKAWVVDEASNAKLKVQFFWPFRGDYWILAIGGDYAYAVVGNPDRDYAWILCRTPRMSPADYAAALDVLRERGFDPSTLQRTAQPASG